MVLGWALTACLLPLLSNSVCVISILRAIFIDQALKNSDFSWAFVSVANWSMAEPNIAIVVPCLVVMKPLTSRAWSSFRSLTLRVMPPDSSSSRNGGANGPVSGEGAGGRARSKDSYPTDRSGSDGSHGDGAGSNREPDLALFELGGSLEAQQQPSNHGLPDGNHRHHVTVARAESEQSDPEVYVDADSKRAAGCSSLDDKKGLSSAATSSAGAATTGDAGPKKLSVMHHTAANDGVECAGSRFRRLWRKW